MSGTKILEVKNLRTVFRTEEGAVPAVDGLDFALRSGETLAIVGESGCGKSVTSMSILGLIPQPPGRIESGEILYGGTDLLKLPYREMQAVRGKEISMIFQEPMTSLNPVFPVGRQIGESLKYHEHLKPDAARLRTLELITMVGIPSPEKCIGNYPHQLSGGMRQRVMIAMALACKPKVLIADEPTTALDVTIQAQILRLMGDLQRKLNTSIILITHDLGIVAQTAHNVMVMYAGQGVEYAPVKDIFREPLHPYTKGLLQSIPRIDADVEELYNIKGTVPSPTRYPAGCRFAPRCQCAMERCSAEPPPLLPVGDRLVRCWKYGRDGR